MTITRQNQIHYKKQSSSGFQVSSDLGQTGNLDSSISQLGPLLGLLKFLLGLAELSQVEGSNLLCLLNLQLVGLNLLLQLGCQFRHSVLVLLVFILSKGKFLNLALSTLEALHALRSMRLNIAKLRISWLAS